MSFEEFQDGRPGRHLGYRNSFSDFECLCVTVMSPIKFQLNRSSSLRDVVQRISRWPWPSWISGWDNFSNFESLCHCDASHQVSAQSDLGFRRRCHLKNFKMAALADILDIGTILAILNVSVSL